MPPEATKTTGHEYELLLTERSTFVDTRGHTGERLDATYDARALPVVKEQLSKAGVRLATMRNELPQNVRESQRPPVS